ncbi:MAG: Maf family protein [Microthrixaceae bacterium]
MLTASTVLNYERVEMNPVDGDMSFSLLMKLNVDLPLPLVLASSSRYRAQMLADAGLESSIDPPQVDERSFDSQLAELGPSGLAVLLAQKKADSVAPRHPAALVLAGDQVGVVDVGGGLLQLHKQKGEEAAARQLMAMSGTTHRLVNGIVIYNTATGQIESGVDIQVVRMRSFTELEAREYLRRFEPYDSSGSYRLEDQELMPENKRFVIDVKGEHASGVLGLPLPLLGRMLTAVTRNT